jgi:Domain of unknown function (DUF4263)
MGLDKPIPKTDFDFYKIRKEGKIFISKVFKFPNSQEEIRNVHIVFENSNIVLTGEIDGHLALRQSPKKKQQVTVIISQDDKKIKKLTLQRFDELKSGDYTTSDEHTFTFRGDEFQKLLSFLKSIEFIDFSNQENFQIEDLSTNTGKKTLIDSSERDFIQYLNLTKGDERTEFFKKIKDNISKKDIDILLGRKEALESFKSHMEKPDWSEKAWQTFFEKEDWIFGYGLDYRIMKPFDRELNVTSAGTDNREKAIVDFIMTFTDYTVTVEMKTPETSIFSKTKGRSGTWVFDSEFIEATSQVLEQKAEWHILGQKSDLYNKLGNEKLLQRTRDAKAILIIGNKAEFLGLQNIREKEIKQDTFELFRRGSRNIEIITFDELLARANFIVNK